MSINCESAELLASDLQVGDLKRVAAAMSQGVQGGSAAARARLSKVKTAAGSLPRAPEAAGKACMKMEAMRRNFRPPHVFLTAALDNINCFLLQARSGKLIDSIEDIGQMTDDELRSKTIARNELRLKAPGFCAFPHEELLNIPGTLKLGSRWASQAHLEIVLQQRVLRKNKEGLRCTFVCLAG